MSDTTTELTRELRDTADTAMKNVKKTAKSVRKNLDDATGNVVDAAQNVFLAGLGALAMAEESGSKTFKKLVKKGKKVDLGDLGTRRIQDVRDQIDRVADDAADAVKGRVKDAGYVAGETADKIEDRIQDAVAAVMKRVGVPTREEIGELTASVERLTAHVEGLKMQKAAGPDVTVEAVGGGWYEVSVDGIVVEKVQGKDSAAEVVARLEVQAA